MPRKLRDALEIVSDIGALGFDLRYHDDVQIRHAVAILRTVNPELFNWLVQALGVDGGAVGDAHEESKPANTKNEPHEIAPAGAVSAEPPAWQPIETAPQDHSWFLAWSEDLGYFVYRSGPGLIAAEEPDPTHWLPLPQPPSAALRAESRARTICASC